MSSCKALVPLTDRRTSPCKGRTTRTSTLSVSSIRIDSNEQGAHLVEIRNIRDIHQIDDGKVLNLLSHTMQSLVHSHTLGIPVVPEPKDDDTIFFRLDCFIYVPAGGKMWEEIRHVEVECEGVVEGNVVVKSKEYYGRFSTLDSSAIGYTYHEQETLGNKQYGHTFHAVSGTKSIKYIGKIHHVVLDRAHRQASRPPSHETSHHICAV